ncbi:Neurogenic locus notch-like protein 3 [Trichoplax sp. H2]|nr:Neurogenic locus notch-like protein 3 [Trichoplax sp. H2]|eukprot:RDD36868.1 Neurogenic locus notch-like protein 3 [Trichoplax sp. H2]
MQQHCQSVSNANQNPIRWYQSNRQPNCTVIAKWINITHDSNPNHKIGRICFHFGLEECSFAVSTRIRSCSSTVSYKLDQLSACYLDYCSKIEGAIDHCLNNKCMHGRCTANDNGYQCDCKEGYHGKYCQLDHCSNNQCKNGHCLTKKNGYTCKCENGYNGEYCQFSIDYCSNNRCVNGICVSNKYGYTCSCQDGYHGKYCQLDRCSNNKCKNGLCVVNKNTYKCKCREGFYGGYCQYELNINVFLKLKSVNHCKPNPCQNGQCIEHINGYGCLCNPGYYGRLCNQITLEVIIPYCNLKAVLDLITADFIALISTLNGQDSTLANLEQILVDYCIAYFYIIKYTKTIVILVHVIMANVNFVTMDIIAIAQQDFMEENVNLLMVATPILVKMMANVSHYNLVIVAFVRTDTTGTTAKIMFAEQILARIVENASPHTEVITNAVAILDTMDPIVKSSIRYDISKFQIV